MEIPGRRRRKVTITLSQSLIDSFKELADIHRRSYNGEIEWALQDYLSRQQPAQTQEESPG